MHLALQIAEVQENIAAHLSTRQDGYALVRTCKALQEPGLNLVWKSMNGFEHFIRCMPVDVWTEVADESATSRQNHPVVTLTRVPTALEWESFRKHAHRVRRFDTSHMMQITSWRGTFNPHISQYALQAVNSHILEQHLNTQKVFFQNATYLYLVYDMRNQLMLKCSPYLAGSKLLQLDLQPYFNTFKWMDTDENEVNESLSSLSAALPLFSGTAPNIRHLRGLPAPAGVQRSSAAAEAKLAATLSELLTLDCEVLIDVSLIAALSRFPNLKTATLTQSSDRSSTNPPVPVSLPVTSFPSLVELVLNLNRVGVITPMLHALRGSRVLRVLNLYAQHVPDQNEMMDAFAAIGQIRSLRRFMFDRRWPSAAFVLDKALISTLLPLHDLEDLQIHAMHIITLVDEDLLQMAEAWPNLRSFSIYAAITPHYRGDRCTISLAGASAFYRACLHLTSLGIDVSNSWTVPSASDPPQLPFPPRSQKGTLTFGFATSIPSYSVVTLVSLAYLLFPSLEKVFSEHDSREEVRTQFKKYERGDWDDLTSPQLLHIGRLLGMGDHRAGQSGAENVQETVRTWFTSAE